MASARSATFYFDLGKNIGMGHLRRCEALGVELARRGWDIDGVIFDPPAGEEPLANVRLSPGFTVLRREAPFAPEVTVVDSYLMPADFREGCKKAGARLVSFRDAPAGDPADLIVDVNCGADPAAYATEGCAGRVLCGPEYFPVRPALDRLARESREKNRLLSATRLLVTFGGSDWHGLAERTLRELAAAGCDMQVRVIAGDLGGKNPALQEALGALTRAELVPAGSELGEQFAWADMALSAAGLTKYELALFGVPAIIVAIAENQAVGAEEFAARGSAFYLGRAEELAPGALARAVSNFALDSLTRAEMSAAGRKLVDGLGASRIADEIEKLMEGPT